MIPPEGLVEQKYNEEDEMRKQSTNDQKNKKNVKNAKHLIRHKSTVKHICTSRMHIRDIKHHFVLNLNDFNDSKKILQKRHPR